MKDTTGKKVSGRLLKRPWPVALALLVVFVLACHVAEGASVRLVFKDQAEVKGPKIVMDHILDSVSGASPALERQIRMLTVDESPAPGTDRIIFDHQINELLGYKSLGLERIQARIPRQIVVRRMGRQVGQEELARAFRQAVMENLPWQPDKIIVEDIKAPQKVLVPVGGLDIQTTPPRPTDLPGRVSLRMRFKVDGKTIQQINVSGLVTFYQQTVVSARPLDRGRIIQRDDVMTKLIQVNRLPDRLVSDPDQIIGSQLKAPLQAGQPVRNNLINNPTLVHRGDKVLLVAQRGDLCVTAAGLIQDQKAAKGDQVRVLNITTRKEVIGQLVNARTVHVFF